MSWKVRGLKVDTRIFLRKLESHVKSFSGLLMGPGEICSEVYTEVGIDHVIRGDITAADGYRAEG